MILYLFERRGRDRYLKGQKQEIKQIEIHLSKFPTPSDLYRYVSSLQPDLKLHYIVRQHDNFDSSMSDYEFPADVLPNSHDTHYWTNQRLGFTNSPEDVLHAVFIKHPKVRQDNDFYNTEQVSSADNLIQEGLSMEDALRYYKDGRSPIKFTTSQRPYYLMQHLAKPGHCSSPNFWLPISRYPGLYVTNTNNKYCGTFYFYEPDSSSYLDLGTACIFASKSHAVQNLIRQYEDEDADEDVALQTDPFEEQLRKQRRQHPGYGKIKIKEILNKSVYSVTESWDEASVDDQDGILPVIPIDPSPFFYRSFNAAEDVFDQLLCFAAREAGIDTLIFQSVSSGNRANTEILDTRINSGNFVCRKNPRQFPPLLIKDEYYGSIWFPKTQGLVYMSDSIPVLTFGFRIDKQDHNKIVAR